MLKQIKEFDGYFISDAGKGNRRTGKTVQLYEIKPRKTKTGYCRVLE